MLPVNPSKVENVNAQPTIIIPMLQQLLLVLLQDKLPTNAQLKQDFPLIIHLEQDSNVLDTLIFV